MKQVKFTMPLRMLAVVFGLILSASAFAQQITVNGHVKDDFGDPVVGATVRVEGTQTMAVTDIDGNFTLQAPQGVTLTVTYIGFADAQAKAAPTVVITMGEDAQAPGASSGDRLWPCQEERPDRFCYRYQAR